MFHLRFSPLLSTFFCWLREMGPKLPPVQHFKSMLSPLQVMYTVFQRDGFDYFSDMMPALHNYVTVDTKAFLSTPDFMMCMYNMAKTMLEGDPGEDPECHAAKLLEVD